MKQLIYHCIQWLTRRQNKSAVREAHKQWGDGWLAPDRLTLSLRLDLARSHTPFNAHLMEEVYQDILQLCARPIEKSPWMWLPLDLHTTVENHLQTPDTQTSEKKRKAMIACAQWMSNSNHLCRTRHAVNNSKNMLH